MKGAELAADAPALDRSVGRAGDGASSRIALDDTAALGDRSSLGRSSEDLSPEPSPAARPQRGAGAGAKAAPAETTNEALPR